MHVKTFSRSAIAVKPIEFHSNIPQAYKRTMYETLENPEGTPRRVLTFSFILFLLLISRASHHIKVSTSFKSHSFHTQVPSKATAGAEHIRTISFGKIFREFTKVFQSGPSYSCGT